MKRSWVRIKLWKLWRMLSSAAGTTNLHAVVSVVFCIFKQVSQDTLAAFSVCSAGVLPSINSQ